MSTANDTRIATVTGVDPYQVQIVGESVPLNIAPIVLADVVEGDYVWCQFFGQQLVVLGRIHDSSVPQLGSTEDLNDFVFTGTWNQPLNANTSLAHNYPDVQAGVLEVVRSQVSGNMVQQRYSTYNNQNVWWRTYYSAGSGWNPWVQIGAGQKATVTLASGLTIRTGGYGLQVMQLGNHMAAINGQVVNTSGGTITSATFTNAGGIPTWACPASGVIQTVAVTGNNTVSSTSVNIPCIQINSDGSSGLFGVSLANSGVFGVVGIYNTI